MAFVPFSAVVAGREARCTALVLHGALGSGQNFRSFVRKLAAQRPDYTFVLVDLRNHGSSHSAPPPHTLATAAEDLRALVSSLSEVPPVKAVIGHSLGGKVALHYGLVGLVEGLEQVWALDSDPGCQQPAGSEEIRGVLTAVKAVHVPVSSRGEVVEALRRQGLSDGLANWMTTNLKRVPEGYTWVFELGAIEELLQDYYRVDFWPILEQARVSPGVHLVVAERSDRWDADMRKRAQQLPPDARVTTHLLPNAGHWVHVDNPDGLLDLMRANLFRG